MSGGAQQIRTRPFKLKASTKEDLQRLAKEYLEELINIYGKECVQLDSRKYWTEKDEEGKTTYHCIEGVIVISKKIIKHKRKINTYEDDYNDNKNEDKIEDKSEDGER